MVDEGIFGFMSPRSMKLHYHHIHWNATKKLNDLTGSEDKSAYFGLSPEVIIRMTAEDRSNAHIFNAAAEFWNHTFFWNCLNPSGPQEPEHVISEALEAWLSIHFGSSKRMRDRFTEAALNLEGSGWVWLISVSGHYQIVTMPNSGCPVSFGPSVAPLLCLDMWEHAYVLDYGASQSARAAYVKNFWSIVNWQFLEDNISLSQKTASDDYDTALLDDIGPFYQRLR